MVRRRGRKKSKRARRGRNRKGLKSRSRRIGLRRR